MTWIELSINMLEHGLLNVGKIVNMKECVVEIIIVNLDVTCIDEVYRWRVKKILSKIKIPEFCMSLMDC